MVEIPISTAPDQYDNDRNSNEIARVGVGTLSVPTDNARNKEILVKHYAMSWLENNS